MGLHCYDRQILPWVKFEIMLVGWNRNFWDRVGGSEMEDVSSVILRKPSKGPEIALLHALSLTPGVDRIVGKGFRFDALTFPYVRVSL